MRERSAMNANPKFLAQTARVDDAAVKPMPNSRKVYVEGSRSDLLVPMREIVQSDTPASFGAEKNEPIFVYDTSAPTPIRGSKSIFAPVWRPCAGIGTESPPIRQKCLARTPR